MKLKNDKGMMCLVEVGGRRGSEVSSWVTMIIDSVNKFLSGFPNCSKSEF